MIFNYITEAEDLMYDELYKSSHRIRETFYSAPFSRFKIYFELLYDKYLDAYHILIDLEGHNLSMIDRAVLKVQINNEFKHLHISTIKIYYSLQQRGEIKDDLFL